MDGPEALRRFREIYHADLVAGRPRPLAGYLALFPGDEATIASEFERLRRDEAASTRITEAPARPPQVSIEELLERLAAQRTDEPDVRQEIGRGGMGAVYEIRDGTLDRDLAMKVLLEQGGSRLRRFIDEARITAQLDHPGVVPVHRLGIDAAGRVFFTMKRVRGRSLSEVFTLSRRGTEGWNQTRAVQVLLRICDTVAFAHARSIVHRDLKPANVMVGSFGEVYVMDWGLAKRVGAPDSGAGGVPSSANAASGVTAEGGVVGTPLYMSPEQAAGAEVGPATDVYAAGALLYELLAVVPPYFEAGARRSFGELVNVVLAGPPRPLSQLAPHAPEELRAVCDKAMARRPEDRYASAAELRDDLQRFIEGRVVRAHRTGAWVELRKWVGRNPALATVSAGIVLLSLLGAIGYGHLANDHAEQLQAQRDAALAASAAAQAAARVADGQRLAAIAPSFGERDPAAALTVALAAADRAPGAEARTAVFAALESYLDVKVLAGHEGYASSVLWSADGSRLLTCTQRRNEAILWDPAAGRSLRLIDDHRGRIVEAKFADSGRIAVTVSADGDVRSWNAADGAALAKWSPYGPRIVAADTAAAEARVAVVTDDGTLRLVDARSGDATLTIRPTGAVACSVRFSPDGKRLVTSAPTGEVTVLDAATGGVQWTARTPAGDGPHPAFATFGPAGRRLLVESGGFHVTVLDAADGAIVAQVRGIPGASLAGDDRLLFTRTVPAETAGCRLTVRDVLSAEPPRTLAVMGLGEAESEPSDVLRRCNIRPSADGATAAVFFDNEGYVFDVPTGAVAATLRGHTYAVEAAALDPSGRRVATAARDETVRVWDLTTSREARGLAASRWAASAVCFVAPDGGRAVVDPRGEGRLTLVDTATAQPLAEFGPARREWVAVSDDCRAALVRVDPEHFEWWDVAGDRLLQRIGPGLRAALSPDGRRAFLIDPAARRTSVFESDGTSRTSEMAEAGQWIDGVSRDGAAYGICGTYVRARFRDAAGGPDRVIAGHGGMVMSAVPSPEGERLLTYAMDGILRAFDAHDLRPLWRVPGLPRDWRHVVASPDGSLVCADRTVVEGATGRVWATLPLAKGEEVRGFSADGRFIVSVQGRTIRRWPADPVAFAHTLVLPEVPPAVIERAAIDSASQAQGAAESYAQRHPSSLRLVMRSEELAAAGDVEGALAAAREAISVRPRNPDAHWALAEALALRAAKGSGRERDADVEAAVAALRVAADVAETVTRSSVERDANLSSLAEDERMRRFVEGLQR